jgi:glycosyltransferase involved in cell wall biosynthesis
MNSQCVVTIVPFYNRRHAVLAALASIAAQTVPTSRLIAVDDGSTDGGADVVRDWINRFRERVDCRLVVQANAGVSAARNRGLALAGTCDYVAFLDSDDVWPRDFLERTTEALAADRRAVAVTCDRRFEFACGKPSQWHDSSQLPHKPSLWMLEHGANIASATLFRRQAVQRRGGFNPQLASGEDSALFLPLSLDGPWLHAPGEPVTFRSGLAAALGDEGNLSGRFRDNHRIWARIYEDFFTRGGGQPMLADPKCQRLLARAWYQAGRELVEHGYPREAATCFRKSVAWNPWRAKYGGWMVRAWLGMLRHSKPSPRHQPLSPQATTS